MLTDAEAAKQALAAECIGTRYEYEDNQTMSIRSTRSVYREGRDLQGAVKKPKHNEFSKSIFQSELHSHRLVETELMERLLKRCAFKGKSSSKGWILVRISTDVVRLAVTSSSASRPKTPNMDGLHKAGYSWPAPPYKVDGMEESRGIYLDHQWRHDVKLSPDADIKLVAIDPGVKKKIQVAQVHLSACLDTRGWGWLPRSSTSRSSGPSRQTSGRRSEESGSGSS
jgi:hypothetical protein